MQLGFLGSLKSSATVIYDALNFDICIRSKDYLHLSDPRSFLNTRLLQAAAVSGVEHAVPFDVFITRWRIPLLARRHAGGTRFDAFLVLGRGFYLICNNTRQSMDAITKDSRWLAAQIPFVELSDKIRANPVAPKL